MRTKTILSIALVALSSTAWSAPIPVAFFHRSRSIESSRAVGSHSQREAYTVSLPSDSPKGVPGDNPGVERREALKVSLPSDSPSGVPGDNLGFKSRINSPKNTPFTGSPDIGQRDVPYAHAPLVDPESLVVLAVNSPKNTPFTGSPDVGRRGVVARFEAGISVAKPRSQRAPSNGKRGGGYGGAVGVVERINSPKNTPYTGSPVPDTGER